jgi:drug/metabolite transporter superfamily protein YnfA
MHWYVYVAHFFGGVFVANSLPHLIAGVSGQPLQSPFAKPRFIGLSSPTVNVAWALVNLALAYLLLVRVGPLDLRNWSDAGVCFLGLAIMAFQCARSLSRLRRHSPG